MLKAGHVHWFAGRSGIVADLAQKIDQRRVRRELDLPAQPEQKMRATRRD